MPNIAAIVEKLRNYIQHHEASFTNLFLVALTLSSEQIFNVAAFNCPCSQPKAMVYGISFLCGPALVIFAVGILVNNKTWRLCQGRCHRPHGSEFQYRISEYCYQCCLIFGKAVIAPLTWIFFALLDGGYYACIMSLNICEEDKERKKELVASSQICSWILLVSVVMLSTLVIITTRCASRFGFIHSRFKSVYKESEKEKFEEAMKKNAQEQADTNVRAFFEKAQIRKIDWDVISMAPTQPVNNLQNIVYFTRLHKWVDQQLKVNLSSNEPIDDGAPTERGTESSL